MARAELIVEDHHGEENVEELAQSECHGHLQRAGFSSKPVNTVDADYPKNARI